MIDYNDASNFWSLDKKPSEGGFSVFDKDDQGKVKKMDHPKTIKKAKDPKVVDEDEPVIVDEDGRSVVDIVAFSPEITP